MENKDICSKEQQDKIWGCLPFEIKEKMIKLYNHSDIGGECYETILSAFGYQNLTNSLAECKFKDIKWQLIDTEGDIEIYSAQNHYPITKRKNKDWDEYLFDGNFYLDEEELISDLEKVTDEWWEYKTPIFQYGDKVDIGFCYDDEGVIIDKIQGILENYYLVKVTKWQPRWNMKKPTTVIISEEDLVFISNHKDRRRNKSFKIIW